MAARAGSESLDPSLRPITTRAEVVSFLKTLPIVVDPGKFEDFVLGFPRRYLETTSAAEVVRNYTLMTCLGPRPVISALTRDARRWHLTVMARDRHFLFGRIAGSLSCFGLNILWAEAFANAHALVLDTFGFDDPSGLFDSATSRREYQRFLEGVFAGAEDLEASLPSRVYAALPAPLEVEWDDEAHERATLLRISGRDHFGLLYRLSHALADARCNIEMAYLKTPGGEVEDRFYLTRSGRKLGAREQERLEDEFASWSAPVDVLDPGGGGL
jgi:[protein-PII] uridylyltransferase